MSTSAVSVFDSIAAQALALPPEQRIELAERLWTSVEGPLEDEALFAVIAQREADVESGKVVPIPFAQTMNEIRDGLK
jgi:putative addiction module component (TIGR02574 family)